MASSDPAAVVRIGTRRSALALKQAETVVAWLSAAHPSVKFEIRAMATAGDRDKITPLPEMGKGLWTSEFEAQLVANEVDIVVHSLKDMPTTLPAGCVLGAVTSREDPRDVVVLSPASVAKGYTGLADLPAGAVVGTSSVRRAAQIRRRFPHLTFKDVRGNIDTRLKKVDDPALGLDCIILAAAGLLRMRFDGRIAQHLSSGHEGGGVLHAVGQGALGIEVREGDEATLALIRSITDAPTMLACLAERAVMRALEGGCSVPIGVETAWEEEGGRRLRLSATVVSLDGTEGVDAERAEEVSTAAEAEAFGLKVAQDLVDKGAGRILEAINAKRATPGAGAVKVGDA